MNAWLLLNKGIYPSRLIEVFADELGCTVVVYV